MLKLLALAALVATSGSVLGQGSTLTYQSGSATLKGYFVKAKQTGNKDKAPGVVVLPAWMGLGDFAKSSADKLAALGYHALAADIYGDGVVLTDMKQAAEKSGYYKKHYDEYQARIKAAIDALIKQGADPDRIAIIGYCFGGTGALEAVRGGLPVKGVVTFHGGLARDTTRPVHPVTAKVLVLHGAADQTMTDAEVLSFQHEMRDSKADWQMIYYADAQHGFTDPAGKAYNEPAARRSWQHMELFFKELFAE